MTHRDHVRRRVRAELAYREISARKLAERIGLSQSSLAARLTGDVDFRVGELEAIANVLGLPVASLLTEPAPETTGSTR